MEQTRLSDARRRLVDKLKRGGPATATELAAGLGLTPAAVRQHLSGLEDHGLGKATRRPTDGPGRPASAWQPACTGPFPP